MKAGDLLFSYETDKASFEEEAKEDGELLAVFYEEGDEVPVLTNVAVLGRSGENIEEFRPGGVGEAALTVPEEAAPAVESAPVAETKEAVLSETREGKIKISPRAKVMAEQLGVP